MDEGLGEYFEMPAETRAWQHPHMKSVRSQARWGKAANIDRLEHLDDLSEMGSEHYRDAWAWVHFILHGPSPARLALESYLQDIEAHVPPGQLSMRLRRSVPDLNRQFVAHFRNWKPR